MQMPQFFPLGGGLDLVTPHLAKKPGRPIAALNYEPVSAGYRRLRGFERFDGRQSPSTAKAYTVRYDANGGAGAVLQILSGAVVIAGGGITIYALADATLVSGTWGTSSAVGSVKMFIDDDADQSISMNDELTNGGATSYGFVDTRTLLTDATSTALAAAKARSLILAVPGSGPVRGVWLSSSNTRVLAVRDNASATAGVTHYAQLYAGWTAVGFARAIAFTSGGTTEIKVGYGVVGATSAATGSVRGVVLTSGSWAGGDAAGTLYIEVSSGVFGAENIDLTAGGANVATVSGPGTAPTLPAGGSYEFINHNFYGASNLRCTYFVNGVGKAHELSSSSVLTPIVTGMTTDTPDHLAEHNGALFLSFPGGSVQFSAVGEPLVWDPIVGAGEIGVGSDVTALVSANQTTLAILAENSINVLYGHDSSDYVVETLTDQAGAIAKSAQKVGSLIYLDNGGLRTLEAAADYGNFNAGTISQLIRPLLEDFRHDDVVPVASWAIRYRDQYWLMFSSGVGIVVFLGKKDPEILPVNLGFAPTCACSVEIDNDERIFFGAADGFVYEFDKGTSFDGDPIEHYIRLPFNHFGSPDVLKRAHKVMIDVQAEGTTSLSVSVDLDYGSVVGVDPQAVSVTTGGGALDGLGENELYYASQIASVAEAYIQATAKNFSLKIAGDTDDEEPHTLTGVTYLLSPRGLRR